MSNFVKKTTIVKKGVKYIVDGKEYKSLEEIPPQYRLRIEKFLKDTLSDNTDKILSRRYFLIHHRILPN